MSIRPMRGEGQITARGDLAEPILSASWSGAAIAFDSRRWECAETELRWSAPHHLVVLTDSGRTSQTFIRSGGRIVYDGRDRAGDISFVPAGVERLSVYRDASLSYSALWIDPALGLPGCGDAGRLGILANGRDEIIRTLLAGLRDELRQGRPPTVLYVEHLAALVLLRLSALKTGRADPPRHAPLARPTLRRVQDYVDAHLASDISLADMAAAAGLPVDSFARRFKAASGQAPYAFVLEERIRRAETLLAQGGCSLGSLAIRLGFSSQSHFTATFRRLRGVTPQAYRSQFLPES